MCIELYAQPESAPADELTLACHRMAAASRPMVRQSAADVASRLAATAYWGLAKKTETPNIRINRTTKRNGKLIRIERRGRLRHWTGRPKWPTDFHRPIWMIQYAKAAKQSVRGVPRKLTIKYILDPIG